MANVKGVNIKGEIPFSVSAHEEMNRYLGQMNGPCFGLMVVYGPERMIDQPNGGMLSLYRFSVEGEEAVRNEWISGLLQAIVNCGGSIDSVKVMDMENDEPITFTIPQPQKGRMKVVMDMTVPDMDDKFSEGSMVVELESLLTPVKRVTEITAGRWTYKATFELRPGFLRKA